MKKTEKQQQFHAVITAEVYLILEMNGITSLLTNSALLGAYRDNDLISHCPGTVLTTFYDEIKPKEEIIIKRLKKKGFKIDKHFINRNWKLRVSKKGLNIEIVGYSLGKDNYYRKIKNKKKVIEKRFLMPPFGNIEVRGITFRCPKDIEGFLNFIYVDWRIKLTSNSSPSKYKSKRHMVID
jgi:hypothetical protein